MNIFGFEIKRKKDDEEKDLVSFSSKNDGEGAVEVIDYGGAGVVGGAVASFLDLSTVAASETELINRYRGMSHQPEITTALDHILNEIVYVPPSGDVVQVIPDDIDYSDKVKDKIRDEFYNILNLLDFTNSAYEIVRRWYIDGTIHYHVIIDEDRPQDGIKSVRYIDPRKIKKVRQYEERKLGDGTNFVTRHMTGEYFVFSETGFNTVINSQINGYSMNRNFMNDNVVISKDSIVSATSGLMDANNRYTLSHLDQAFRPLNSLRIQEDAVVIYRVTRAPERRAFYIDVSGLPPSKAESHVKSLMDRHNKKMQYNSATGEIVDESRVMTMTDDYWLPRKDGSRGTEIVPLAGGANLGEMEDVLYFQKALYKALKIPISRLDSEAGSFLGRQSEISREEQNFALFINRLRARFSSLFDHLLERQLILKKIINADDWASIKNDLRYDFMKNNFFEELKQMEIMRERIGLLTEAEQFVGKYISKEYVMEKVLHFNEDEADAMYKQIEEGKKKGFYDEFSDDDGNDNFDHEPSVSEEPPKVKPEKPETLDIKKKTDNKDLEP